MKAQRKIIFYGNYFIEFYTAQSSVVQEKIDYVFTILRTVDRVPRKFLEHMEGADGLYEIRVEYGGSIFRIFCCFDKGSLVILFNGFQKKSQKTPRQELELAVRLKKEYFSSKNNTMKKKTVKETKSFDELLDVKYGEIGTKKRDRFEEKAQYFVISEMLKEARKEAHMTQEELADKLGTKKSYISRIENGRCDIQISTLYRIFEFGLGKRISLLIG